ncbi:MAG: short chain dehydrogenase [Planctomycetes bacterium]|nr:short chain dehydrogenase [Planctomycetota bacterium]
MKVLVVGASGTIGKAVADAIEAKGHQVVRASRHGEQQVDIQEPASIRAMYERVGKVDAVVSCAGNGAWKALGDLSDADLEYSWANKLLGNINLVRHGIAHVNDGGNFILTSGMFSQQPMPGVTALAMINGGLESFTRGAALDLPRNIRINTISPPFIKETAEKLGMPGGLPTAENAKTYIDLLEGNQTGKVVATG